MDAQKPETPSSKPIKRPVQKIVINLSQQKLFANTDKKTDFEFHCVSGDADHPTPKGKFKILKKYRIYRSRSYDAQMNYALQLTTSGIFIHESYNFVENPKKQNFFATKMSDSTAFVMSHIRSAFPNTAKAFGSHGCVRLAHSDAVKLFDWAQENDEVEIITQNR